MIFAVHLPTTSSRRTLGLQALVLATARQQLSARLNLRGKVENDGVLTTDSDSVTSDGAHSQQFLLDTQTIQAIRQVSDGLWIVEVSLGNPASRFVASHAPQEPAFAVTLTFDGESLALILGLGSNDDALRLGPRPLVAGPLRPPPPVLVAAPAAAGGVAADMSTIDAYYFSPQKNLSSDGGLWLAILSPAAIERSNRVTSSARWVPQMLDLSLAVTNSRADQTLNTPALATLVMLEAQCRWLLDQGGMAWAASRTASTSGILYRWAEDNPLTTPFVADPALRSPVVVTIDIDESVDAARLCARARDNGILDIEPYRTLGRNQIRIATFSSIEPSDVEALTACLDWLLDNRD